MLLTFATGCGMCIVTQQYRPQHKQHLLATTAPACIQSYQLDEVFGSFKDIVCDTADAEELQAVREDDENDKFLRNGQLYILHDGQTYTIQGSLVK